MAHEIELEDGKYISSKKAAEMYGYTQDYIGQLARGGHIDAKRIGGLWYVKEDALTKHKEKAESYAPTPPERANKEETHDVISLDGSMYISALKASNITGYNQDYVGQLARSGKVLSRQIGNRWYVEKEGIVKHKREKDSLLGAVQAESVGLTKISTQQLHKIEKNDLFYSYSVQPHTPFLPLENKANDEQNSIEIRKKKEILLNEENEPVAAVLSPIRVLDISNSKTTSQAILKATKKGNSHKKRKGNKTIYAGALLTVVIVLALGLQTTSIRSVFSPSEPNLIQQQGASAGTSSIFDKIASFFEQFIPLETYKRNH